MRFLVSMGNNRRRLILSAPADAITIKEDDLNIFINTDNPPSEEYIQAAVSDFIQQINGEG